MRERREHGEKNGRGDMKWLLRGEMGSIFHIICTGKREGELKGKRRGRESFFNFLILLLKRQYETHKKDCDCPVCWLRKQFQSDLGGIKRLFAKLMGCQVEFFLIL